MEALKNWYGEDFFRQLCTLLTKANARINDDAVLAELMHGLEALELKQRIDRIVVVLRRHLPQDFKQAVRILERIAPDIEEGFYGVFIPEFIGRYGAEELEFSLEKLAAVTQYSTSEFAIRDFLRRDFARTHQAMISWSENDNHHVRRLASEGLRPRLPWSFKLYELIHDPSLSQEILTNLRADSSDYVRKSVANHINDISKDNPEFALDLLESWEQNNRNTRWIIKRAARTLIKNGDARALALFGYEREPRIKIRLTSHTPHVKRGEAFEATWNIVSSADLPQKLLIDYAIVYVRQHGKNQRKVFKLKELELPAGARIDLRAKTSFRDMTTRKHYAGTHQLELQVNGQILHRSDFEFLG